MKNRSLTTKTNRVIFRKFEIAAAKRGMTVSSALKFIAMNSVSAFRRLNGGVHQP